MQNTWACSDSNTPKPHIQQQSLPGNTEMPTPLLGWHLSESMADKNQGGHAETAETELLNPSVTT